MKKENKKCSANKVFMVVGVVSLTIAGFIVISPLIEKYSNKMYKNSLKKEEIDFDNMGPEIVTYDKTEGE